jgi:hypothetical protein
MELLKHRLLRKGKGYFIEQPLDTKLKINDKFYLDCFLGGEKDSTKDIVLVMELDTTKLSTNKVENGFL